MELDYLAALSFSSHYVHVHTTVEQLSILSNTFGQAIQTPYDLLKEHLPPFLLTCTSSAEGYSRAKPNILGRIRSGRVGST